MVSNSRHANPIVLQSKKKVDRKSLQIAASQSGGVKVMSLWFSAGSLNCGDEFLPKRIPKFA